MTAHAGLMLVRELAARLGLPGLLDRLTVKPVGAASRPPRR
jgi:hypothetical protein